VRLVGRIVGPALYRGIVSRLDSYTEVSSSGTGLHIVAEGDHSDDHKHRGDLSEVGHLEVYDESRYFVLTGDVYEDFTPVESRATVVREVQDDHLPKVRSSLSRASRSL
jgi:putative DNA primase/helicase